MSDDIIYEKLVHQNDDKGIQIRLVLSRFRDEDSLHIRKYYLSYEGEYLPSNEGIGIPTTIQSVYALLDGLLAICAREENIDGVVHHFYEVFKRLENERENQAVS